MSGLSDAEAEALTRVQEYLGCIDDGESEEIDGMLFGRSYYALTTDDLRIITAVIDRIPALLSQARKSAISEVLARTT